MVAACLTDEELDDLRRFDTCMVANAVEAFNVRLHNTGFTDASIRCMFEDAPPLVGYAVTARLRSGEPPMVGHNFHDRADFWNALLKIPAPRVLVLEDQDDPAGRGAFVGDMHAAILKALNCVGYLTNGAVRELPAVRAMGLRLFAGNVAVSHAYAHIFDVGCVAKGGWDGGASGGSAARRSSRRAHNTEGDRCPNSGGCGRTAADGAEGDRVLPVQRFFGGKAGRAD